MNEKRARITQLSGRIDRVAHGLTPSIDLDLHEGEYVAWVELKNNRYAPGYDIDRKTVDWSWTAYVVTPLQSGSGVSA